MRIFLFLLNLFTSVIILSSCTTVDIASLPEEQGIERLREQHKEENWQGLIKEAEEYKIRYPYSKHNSEIELLLADGYFLTAQYPQAIETYEAFLKKYPLNKNVPFAHFRMARCYDLQDPSRIEREKSNARKALTKYSEFITHYPQSDNVAEAVERKKVLEERILEHNLFVADFYFRQEKYEGALFRYSEILMEQDIPVEVRRKALKNSSICFKELAKELKKDPNSERSLFFKMYSEADMISKSDELAAAYDATPSQNP